MPEQESSPYLPPPSSAKSSSLTRTSKRCSAATTRTSSTSNRSSASASAPTATSCWSKGTPPTSARAERVARPARRADARRLQAGQGGREDGGAARRPGRERRRCADYFLRGAPRTSGKRQVTAEERQPAPLPRSHRAARHRVRHRPRRHRQDLPGDGAGGVVPAGQEGEPDHPGAAGGRGRREARVPAGRSAGEGQPVPAAALRRALRHARDGARRRGCSSAARSRSRRSRSCAAARSTTRSSSSTRRRTRPPSR